MNIENIVYYFTILALANLRAHSFRLLRSNRKLYSTSASISHPELPTAIAMENEFLIKPNRDIFCMDALQYLSRIEDNGLPEGVGNIHSCGVRVWKCGSEKKERDIGGKRGNMPDRALRLGLLSIVDIGTTYSLVNAALRKLHSRTPFCVDTIESEKGWRCSLSSSHH